MVNVGATCADVIMCFYKFTFASYLTSPANWLDWTHFSLMTAGWVLWYRILDQSSKFSMQPKFPILASPDDQTLARILKTSAETERDFLLFSQSISALQGDVRMYTNIAGLCGRSFVICSYPWLCPY
jgi:hypothetical protein